MDPDTKAALEGLASSWENQAQADRDRSSRHPHLSTNAVQINAATLVGCAQALRGVLAQATPDGG